MYEVTNHHDKAGRNNQKKSKNHAFPDVHAISVVMSPKGLNTPPAFAATTILRAQIIRKSLSFVSVNITVERIKAVVRLSTRGERKKARNHIIQYIFL